MIPQKIVDKMEEAERRFYYCHESLILYGKSYDKQAMRNATKEMNASVKALRKIYLLIVELYKNERTEQREKREIYQGD